MSYDTDAYPIAHIDHRADPSPNRRQPVAGRGADLSDHAWQRMSGRGVSQATLDLVFRYGRTRFVRGAQVMVIGHREVREQLSQGVDLRHAEGVHVVCASDGATIVTTYRNRDLRGLRPARDARRAPRRRGPKQRR